MILLILGTTWSGQNQRQNCGCQGSEKGEWGVIFFLMDTGFQFLQDEQRVL